MNTCQKRPQHAPYPYQKSNYGAKIQYVENEDNSEILSQSEVTHIQKNHREVYYYARAVDLTMITTIGELASSYTTKLAATNVTKN